MQRAKALVQSMRRSPSLKCFSAVASDGVLRQFDSQGIVIDYRRLCPDQIEDFIQLWVLRTDESKRGYMREQYSGADGRNVSLEACLKPSRDVLPPGVLKVVERKESVEEKGTDGC